MNQAGEADFLPAAGFHFLTPIYEIASKPVLGPVWRRVSEDLAQKAGPGASIVDLGCGPGTVLDLLRQTRGDLHLTGVDIDPRILAIARRRLPQTTFLQASLSELPIDDQSFDVAFSSMVFHHLPKHLKPRALSEARRILKPGGLLLLCDFSVPVSRTGRWLARFVGLLEKEAVSQTQGELLELAAAQSLTLQPYWTHWGCITQYEVGLAKKPASPVSNAIPIE